MSAQGKVIAGRSVVDESMLTGESLPVFKEKAVSVSAGTINWVWGYSQYVDLYSRFWIFSFRLDFFLSPKEEKGLGYKTKGKRRKFLSCMFGGNPEIEFLILVVYDFLAFAYHTQKIIYATKAHSRIFSGIYFSILLHIFVHIFLLLDFSRYRSHSNK